MPNVRQYIGARYVTKIYENSLDPSSAEWEAGVNYEPLVLVTYNNGSYLSKKDVPAAIGNPAANPTYWVQTGYYNGQISSLQSRVTTLEEGAYYVTPEQFGAVGDGVTDDTDAIQAALDTKLPVIFKSPRYYISDTLYISGHFNQLIDASNSRIDYDGAGYAIDIEYMDYCNLKIGYLFCDNGNGIYWHSDGPSTHSQYNEITVKELKTEPSTGIGIMINPSASGWINENRFIDCQFAQGQYGVYIKNDATINNCNQNNFYNVSPEGVDILFKLESGSARVTDMLINGCRAHESFNKLYEIIGDVSNIHHIMTHTFDPSWIDSSSGRTIGWTIEAPFVVGTTTYIGAYSDHQNNIVPIEQYLHTYSPNAELAANTDLNNVKHLGQYSIPGSIISTLTNFPSGLTDSCVLTVTGLLLESYPKQTIEVYNSHVRYVRTGNANGTSWGAWKKVVTMDDYTDEVLSIDFSNNANPFYAFTGGRTAHSIELLYASGTGYDLLIAHATKAFLVPNSAGIQFSANTTFGTGPINVHVRVWYA